MFLLGSFFFTNDDKNIDFLLAGGLDGKRNEREEFSKPISDNNENESISGCEKSQQKHALLSNSLKQNYADT